MPSSSPEVCRKCHQSRLAYPFFKICAGNFFHFQLTIDFYDHIDKFTTKSIWFIQSYHKNTIYYTAIKYKYLFIFIHHRGAAVTLTMLRSFFSLLWFQVWISVLTSVHMSYANRKIYCRKNYMIRKIKLYTCSYDVVRQVNQNAKEDINDHCPFQIARKWKSFV